MFKTTILILLYTSNAFAYECGKFYPPRRRPDDMIIAGYRAYVGLFPWIVSLQVKATQNEYKHVCGGAIIGENWIITAAHCVEDPDTPIERINAGSLVWDYSYNLHTPEKVIIHSSSRTTSDIALVKVTPSFLFKEGDDGEGAVGPICLPSDEQHFKGTVTLSGWGVTNESNIATGTHSRELFAVNIPILDDLVCQQYSNFFSPGPYMCTGPSMKKKQQGGCYGDSGGPLAGIVKNKAYLVGVVSGANTDLQCAVTENPILYAKVSTFRKWIRLNSGI